MSVARCYVVKNRQQEVVPYDRNRVELPTTKDDYINASHVRDLTEHAPRAIATQAPLARTFGDFWTMVAQEQVETIVCLLSPDEMVSQKPLPKPKPHISQHLPLQDDVYWPDDRQTPLVSAKCEITLQGTRQESGRVLGGGGGDGRGVPRPQQGSPTPRWTERTLTVRSADTNVSRVAIHLQLDGGSQVDNQSSIRASEISFPPFSIY